MLSHTALPPLPPVAKDWYFIAEQPAPAQHLAHPEGCAALRIVLVTVSRVSCSCENFSDVFNACNERCGLNPGSIKFEVAGGRVPPLYAPPPRSEREQGFSADPFLGKDYVGQHQSGEELNLNNFGTPFHFHLIESSGFRFRFKGREIEI